MGCINSKPLEQQSAADNLHEQRQQLEEQWRKLEEDRKKVEEDRQKLEEDRKKVEEDRQKLEDDRKKVEEDRQKLEEDRQKWEEDRQKFFEERQKFYQERQQLKSQGHKQEERLGLNHTGVDVSNTINRFEDIYDAVNGFDDTNVIGTGAFAIVYKGKYAGDDVAVKRLRHNIMSENEIEREIFALQRLFHRNIVKMIGFYISDQEKIIVYPMLEHGNLDDNLHGEKKSQGLLNQWSKRFQILGEIAIALEYMHHSNYGHRDIKPANVLLNEKLSAVVGDLGISKYVGEGESSSASAGSDVKGTANYTDPAYVSTTDFTPAADVYSFGIVAYEVISGRRVNDRREFLLWARSNTHDAFEGVREPLIDPLITYLINDQLKRVLAVAFCCTKLYPEHRPRMSRVVDVLTRDGDLEQCLGDNFLIDEGEEELIRNQMQLGIDEEGNEVIEDDM